MKKIYLQPVTETVELEGRALMDNLSFNNSGSGSITPVDEEGDGPVMSRDYDWDD